jgi:hypothetical protein
MGKLMESKKRDEKRTSGKVDLQRKCLSTGEKIIRKQFIGNGDSFHISRVPAFLDSLSLDYFAPLSGFDLVP